MSEAPEYIVAEPSGRWLRAEAHERGNPQYGIVPYVRRDLAGWRPIETAPKDGTEIQLWRGAHAAASVVNGRWQKIGRGGRWEINYGSARIVPAPPHWQPLPEPPEQADG